MAEDEFAGLDLTGVDLVDVHADDAAIEAIRAGAAGPADDPVLASLMGLGRAVAGDVPEAPVCVPPSGRTRLARTGVRVAAAVTGLAFAAGTGMAAAQSDDPFHPIRDIFEWGLRIGEAAASPSREADHGAARNLEPRPHTESAEPRAVAAREIGTETRPRAHAEGDQARPARHPRHSRGGGRDELAHAHDRDHEAHPSGPVSRDDHGAKHRGPTPGHDKDSPSRGSDDADENGAGDTEDEPTIPVFTEDSEETQDDPDDETPQDGTQPERPSPSTQSDPR